MSIKPPPRLLHRLAQQRLILLPHPRPRQRMRAHDQHPVGRVPDPFLQPPGEPVPAYQLPLIQEHLEPGTGTVDTLAPMLIGTGHLLFAGREGTPPEAGAVEKVVTTAIAGVVPEPLP